MPEHRVVPADSSGGAVAAPGPLRVLVQAGGIAGAYAGWLLAQLGADVSRIEEPRPTCSGSEPVRLAFDYYVRDMATLRAPIRASAGAVAVPGDEGALDRFDLLLSDCPDAIEARFAGSPEELIDRYPGLVVGLTSVFGGTEGCRIPATSLDAQAVSGVSWVLGEPTGAPLSFPPGIVEHQAGVNLAAASLLACSVARERGTGRIVDVALADVLATYVGVNCRYYVHHGLKWQRAGRRPYASAGAYPFVILPCKDGAVSLVGISRDEWLRLVKAMGEPPWSRQTRYQRLRAMGTEYPEEVDALVAAWLADITRDQFDRIAAEFKLTAAPVRTVAEVPTYPQLEDRHFFRPHAIGGREVRAPGLPFRISEERAADATAIGAKMLAIGAWRPNSRQLRDGDRPLGGLRILDFGWVWSAPWVTGLLTEYGAEVIKVEHVGRMDSSRLLGPVLRDGAVVEGDSTEMSPLFHQVNHGKKSVSLNLKNPQAVALLQRLVATCDVVIENMVPGALERAGLGYETLRMNRPDLVMLSMSGAGQFGPLAGMRTYAPLMSGYAGLDNLVGYREQPPLGCIGFGVGDPNATSHGLLALLAALFRRQATGKGSYIDLSQTEALICTVTPYLLAVQAGGPAPVPLGNGDDGYAPRGIYPAAGHDRWLCLSAATQSQWQALCRLAPDAPWAGDERFRSPADRLSNRNELDAMLGEWTRRGDRDRLVQALRASGVAASPVLSVQEQRTYPSFVARSLLQEVPIPQLGDEGLHRSAWRFSDIEARIPGRGPRLGEHTRPVLTTALGLSDQAYDELVAAGVID